MMESNYGKGKLQANLLVTMSLGCETMDVLDLMRERGLSDDLEAFSVAPTGTDLENRPNPPPLNDP
jgi:hypothetical protein